jgi:hypothetical protein
MKLKRIMSEVKLVIAEVEVELNGTLRSSPTLCALISNGDGAPDSVVPLNTPDGRPIFMKIENAIRQ